LVASNADLKDEMEALKLSIQKHDRDLRQDKVVSTKQLEKRVDRYDSPPRPIYGFRAKAVSSTSSILL
jgi:hypothetical protein